MPQKFEEADLYAANSRAPDEMDAFAQLFPSEREPRLKIYVGNHRFLASSHFPRVSIRKTRDTPRSDLLWSQIAAKYFANLLEHLPH